MSYTNIYDVAMAQYSMSFALGVIVLALLAMVVATVLTMRKSKQYRKEIMDMYVAAKTKSIAKGEGLDLAEEYESFKKWLKKQRINCNYDLDDTIEAELKERVSETKPKE